MVRSRGSDGPNPGFQHWLWDHRIFTAYIKSIFLLIWTLTLVKNNLMEILPSSFHKSINYLFHTTNFLKAAGASLASRSSLTLKVSKEGKILKWPFGIFLTNLAASVISGSNRKRRLILQVRLLGTHVLLVKTLDYNQASSIIL